VLVELGLRGGVDDPPGELGDQPAGTGYLLGAEALQGLVQGVCRQQIGQPLPGLGIELGPLIVLSCLLRHRGRVLSGRRPIPLRPPGFVGSGHAAVSVASTSHRRSDRPDLHGRAAALVVAMATTRAAARHGPLGTGPGCVPRRGRRRDVPGILVTTCDVFPQGPSRPGRLMGVTACQDPHEAPGTPGTISDSRKGHEPFARLSLTPQPRATPAPPAGPARSARGHQHAVGGAYHGDRACHGAVGLAQGGGDGGGAALVVGLGVAGGAELLVVGRVGAKARIALPAAVSAIG